MVTSLKPLTLAGFRQLAHDHDSAVVVREVLADLDTPITAFWKLKRGSHSFLLESVEGGETWARYTFMGTDPQAVFTVRGEEITVTRGDRAEPPVQTSDPLQYILSQIAPGRCYMPPSMPRFASGVVGAISYDAVRLFEHLPSPYEAPEPPDMVFFHTRVVLVWDNLKHRAMLITVARFDPERDVEDVWHEAQTALSETMSRLQGPLPLLPVSGDHDEVSVTLSMDDDAFCEAVSRAKRYIEAGDIIQVVLSRSFSQPDLGLHPFLVYRTLRGLNPSPYMFYMEIGEVTLVGASPEVLVRKTGDRLESRPIAGTRPRGDTPEADAALARELQGDEKERAEHVMLVDLARNDLGRVSQIGSVVVTESEVIERYSHVMHLVSHVIGDVAAPHTAEDVVKATFPAGTLSGAPKVRAMEIIDELEGHSRGFYGGAVGTIGIDGNIEFCISIRMLTAQGGRLVTQAGAGIVFDSVPAREAAETSSKASAVLRAIAEARTLFKVEETCAS